MSLISLDHITVGYKNFPVLKDFTLKVESKDFVAIVGENGSGKSTLLKTILGQIKPQHGAMTIDRHANIGYVPQVYKFKRDFPITVEEVVLSGMLPRRIKLFHEYSNLDRNLANETMSLLGIEHLKDRAISKISGGQLQKSILARALITKPDILLLDEATSNIDEKTTIQIFELLKQLNQELTILMVCHSRVLAESYAKEIVNLETGEWLC